MVFRVMSGEKTITPNELKAKCRKYKVTAKKYEGDDLYSWAVFVNGRPVYTGLGRREIDYYKRIAVEIEEERRK